MEIDETGLQTIGVEIILDCQCEEGRPWGAAEGADTKVHLVVWRQFKKGVEVSLLLFWVSKGTGVVRESISNRVPKIKQHGGTQKYCVSRSVHIMAKKKKATKKEILVAETIMFWWYHWGGTIGKNCWWAIIVYL